MSTLDASDYRERLMKLVRMLSSPNDGEVLNAARALERTLKANGHSFHSLAGAIAGQIVEVTKVVERVVEKEKIVEVEVERIVERVVQVEVDHSCETWIRVGRGLLKSGRLAMHEQQFVEDMVRRFELWPEFQPSPKQVHWFAKLYRRCAAPAPVG
jgi:hypothetical protein